MEIWRAAPYDLKRESKRIRNLRSALPLLLAMSLIYLFSSSEASVGAMIIDFSRKTILIIVVLVLMWRLAIRAAIRQANKVHAWAIETLREPDMFLAHPADASAISAPWVDIDSKIIEKAKTGFMNKFRK